ncbi:GH12 family glycosyl hydrolase domain-containing protein [Streptomyces sp. YU58]|uniref:GH12 family glycosyl hydrolase domain-containing protein n=1 Tax=Streptomyces sp. SX92 TaxID=3158972 RepID=UPI0027B94A9B|nr:endo-1,4-beta-glucanase [Streptomyces coralus]WLW51854.1 endo-1,4-beta-glucanase [Streptomyces coralus]
MSHRRSRLSKKAKTLVATTVALSAALGVTVAQADEANKKCAPFDTITLGKYYVNNNLWNEGKFTGTQCVWSNSQSGSTISWGTNYSLANSATGKDYDVKTYASTVLGWHWGWKVDKASTGLPIRVGDRKPVRTSWDFTVSPNPGTMNVAYDLWLHTKNTADWQDQLTDEIMIWLNRQGGAGPLGTKYGSVSLGGAMWDIYQGNIGWNVYSFVRQANTSKASLNLDDFTQALVRRNLLSNDKYVSGIESGTEVFKGTGRLDTKAYSVDIG